MPFWTSGTACAATPSSSQPNVPSPPGAVASATIVDQLGAVPEAVVELVRRQEARAGVGRLGAEDPVQLGRVAAALVDLEVQLRRVEDDRAPAGRALRRGQQRDGLLGERLGAAREVEAADVLVAAAW